jgi:RNase H-like domain found in reverse transcriptase/Reverse transcriptase (RNA-dependent DNA polymerase)/Integrase zinc binding domain/Integrase core domain
MNKVKRDAMQEIINEYIKRGIVEPSNSPWNAPAFLVKKQHGPEETMASKRWRVVEDYRQLNTTIRDEVFTPSSVQELIDIVGSANKYYCSIDLRQGYHQIPLKASDREKTTFSTGGLAGKLQYRVLQYGLKHGGQVFQRTMEKILGGLINRSCLVYVDDILIFAETFDKFLINLDEVIGRISIEGGSIDLGKSKFLAEEIDFLGHTIGKNVLMATEKDISAIANYKRPTSKKEMLSFLGLASYERKYVPHFAKYEKILRDIIDPKVKHIIWNSVANDNFIKPKDKIAKQNILAHFNESYATEIFCDASGSCLGAVLCQTQPEGGQRVVQYASRTLSAVEQRYSNTKKELLAIVWAVTKKFRFYTEYRKFKVFTDHKALIGRTKLSEEFKRVVRLWLKLAEFEMTLEHLAGVEMIAADALSRYVAGAATTVDHSDKIKEIHIQTGHRCWKATYELLKRTDSWPNMRQDVWRIVRTCPVCIRYNIETTKIGNKLSPIKTLRPKEMLCLDNWGPISTSSEGYKYCLVGIDHFSKAVTILPTAIMNAEVSIHFIELAFSMLGTYQKILTDSGPYFTSGRFKEWCGNRKIELHIATPAHPEANGCCERFIRTFQQSRVKTGAHTLNWHEHIADVVNGYNNCYHSSIGCTPITCHFTDPTPGKPEWDKIMDHVNKKRGDMVAKDKKEAISLGDRVFVVP